MQVVAKLLVLGEQFILLALHQVVNADGLADGAGDDGEQAGIGGEEEFIDIRLVDGDGADDAVALFDGDADEADGRAGLGGVVGAGGEIAAAGAVEELGMPADVGNDLRLATGEDAAGDAFAQAIATAFHFALGQADGSDDPGLADGVIPERERGSLDVEPIAEQRHGMLKHLA